MDYRIARLSTPEECRQFIINVEKADPALADQARRRSIELQAQHAGGTTEVEREAYEAVYAYEAVLSKQKGKRVCASRTWQMIKRHGIIGAVERAVNRPDDPSGYTALVAIGMEDLSFEAIVLRYPESFSSEAIGRCQVRLTKYKSLGSHVNA